MSSATLIDLLALFTITMSSLLVGGTVKGE